MTRSPLFERAVRCVSAELGGVADVATCVRWMLVHLARTHASPEHEARWSSHAILERAGWLCSMPHCRECTALQVHHPHQRSQGGPLVPENEAADCETCHLHVIHAGHATTKGTPPDDLLVGLGASSPGGPRELWRDERLIARAPRLTPRWRPSC